MIMSFLPIGILADSNNEKDERKAVIGLFGSLIAPSIFSSAKTEHLAFSIHGRTITNEGEVPDYDLSESPKDNIDSYQIYLNGRFGGFGATLGFGQGNEFEFSQPLILSVDYKLGLFEDAPLFDAAIDAQYSLIYLPKADKIKVSAPGFGVASINGLVGANLIIFEPYAGITLNYVYLNSEDELFSVWKPIPKLGLKIKPLPLVNIGGELSFLMNEKPLNNSWIWNFGASVRF
jgi:hypothetical protein